MLAAVVIDRIDQVVPQVLRTGKVGNLQSFFRLARGNDLDIVIGEIDACDVDVVIVAAELLVIDTGTDAGPPVLRAVTWRPELQLTGCFRARGSTMSRHSRPHPLE